MSRSTVRTVSSWAASAVLLAAVGAVAEPSGAAEPSQAAGAPVVGVQPGQQVRVDAAVPTTAKATIKGGTVVRRVVRPARLERLSGTRWQSVTTRRTSRAGRVGFTFAAPMATTRYRVVAPALPVRLSRTLHGRRVTKRVVLRPWTGSVRTVTVTPPPAQPPLHRLSLLTHRASNPAARIHIASMDAAGGVVAFGSEASDLVEDDNNGTSDVFVVDTATGAVELLSRGLDGTPASQGGWQADVSPDGRYVAFLSNSSDLVEGFPGGPTQIFLHDRVTKTTELVSATPAGVPGDAFSQRPSVSRDGEFVTFETEAMNLAGELHGAVRHVVRHRMSTGQNRVATVPSEPGVAGDSGDASLSADGSRVAFTSLSAQLVPNDDNGREDVFVYDFDTGVQTMVSRQPDGRGLGTFSHLPIISADGNAVVWHTRNNDVVVGDRNDSMDAFRYDVARRTNTLLSRGPDGLSLDGVSRALAVSADGSRALLFSTWQSSEDGLNAYLADTTGGPPRPLGIGPFRSEWNQVGALDAGGRRAVLATVSALTPDDTAAGDDLYLWESLPQSAD